MKEFISLIVVTFLAGAIVRTLLILFSERKSIKSYFLKVIKRLNQGFFSRFRLLTVLFWVFIAIIQTLGIYDYEGLQGSVLFFTIMCAPIIWIHSLKWLLQIESLGIISLIFYIFISVLSSLIFLDYGKDFGEHAGMALLCSLIPTVLLYGADMLLKFSTSDKNEPSSR